MASYKPQRVGVAGGNCASGWAAGVVDSLVRWSFVCLFVGLSVCYSVFYIILLLIFFPVELLQWATMEMSEGRGLAASQGILFSLSSRTTFRFKFCL